MTSDNHGHPVSGRFIYGPENHALAASLIATALDSPDPNLVTGDDGEVWKLPMGAHGYSDLDRLVGHAAEQGIKADDLIKAIAWEAALMATAVLSRQGAPLEAIALAVRTWAQETATAVALIDQDGAGA